MKVCFRVDASIFMGTGHFMRCLSLAETLRERGAEVRFVCREHPGHMAERLACSSITVTLLPAPPEKKTYTENYADWLGVSQETDAAETIEALRGGRPDWLVVDHYGLDASWERLLQPHVGKVLVIDDLANRQHDCDALLDQNYSLEGAARYQGQVSIYCRLLVGVRYALIRREFQIFRRSLRPRDGSLKRILIFFTAGDDQGETVKAMNGVYQYGKADVVDVVVGHSNLWKEEIGKICTSRNWNYHCQIDYMVKLIAQADIVIGASGSSSWERCALGVPTLVTILADNQAPIAQALEHMGAVYNLGWCRDLQAEDYSRALNFMNDRMLVEMSKRASQLVDAGGADRVVDTLLAVQPELIEQSKQVSC